MTDALAPGGAARAAPRSGASRRVLGLVGRHWALVLLIAAAATVRVLAVEAISPGIWFSDSNSYIRAAATGWLSPNRVMGYALVVTLFWHLGSAGALIVVQHVVGLLLVVALYALLIRRGTPRWLALLGVVPAALDGYLIFVEHTIMSETSYHALVVASLLLLLWDDRVAATTAAAIGLLLGYAAVVRSVAVPFLALVLLYLLVRRAGWRPVVALCLGWAVVAGAYMVAFHRQYDAYAFTRSDGRFLYGRVAPFADCTKLGALPADERALCPDPRHRLTTNQYMWSPQSPMHGLPPSADARIRDFARRVVLHQPAQYARVVGHGVLHYFEPGHRIGANDYPVQAWQFPADPRVWKYPGYRGPIRPGDPARRRKHPVTEPNRWVGHMVRTPPRFHLGPARFMHRYQHLVYSYGPMLAVCVLLVLAALVARRGAWRLRLDAALLAAMVLAALLMSQALSVFSYRYGMIAGLLLPVAAALAVTALLSPRRPPAAAGAPDAPGAGA